MDPEITTPDSENTAPTSPRATSLQRELIEMFAKNSAGNGSGDRLKQLLALTQLTSEQHAVVDLLLSLDESERDSAEMVAEEPAHGAADTHAAAGDAGAGKGHRVHELTQEIEILREVNDTLALALGACGTCWGGNPGCPACAGQGRAGFVAPDLDLFRELVVPAIRRVNTLGRERGRAGFSRDGSGSPRQRRSFDER
jgi:hypothetical protein